MAFQASSSSFGRRWPYDVFLSFRSEDTHLSFTACLYKALCENGIYTYMYDKFRGEGEISPEILKAIKDSRTSIVVLSENYASSTCCLSELIEILRSRESNQQIVLPVFYKIDPSDVRHQKKNFGEASAQHQDSFMEETVQSWKVALNKVANLSGWHLEKGGRNEFKFINEIVQLVSRIVNRTYQSVPKYLVGIESHIQDINGLLHIGMSDIRVIGIFGAGGIGKTTIAKAIYNSFAYQFKDSCFLANVRETSMKECGLVQLQETLLSEILGNSSLKVSNVDRGINVIKERLCRKNVLLVLDDVDELVQLKALSGEPNWFGLGSRIIITTRDEHLLIKHNVDFTYKMNEMDHNETFQLFSIHAFKSDKPHDYFVDLIEDALRYAGGLPLALTVLGSNLYGRDIHYWKSALEKYKRIPEKNILEKLQLSYDGLDESEKNIFLDIACFFKGQNEKYVTEMLDSCGFNPVIGIAILVEKSLITIDHEVKLAMHDLLQDMGKEIVRQESPKRPGKRSRLWFHEDVRDVLEKDMGTNKIEGILVELPERGLVQWSCKTFEKMKRLRLFICRNAVFSKMPTCLPNELKVLDWNECPLQYLPSNFHGRKLTILRICNGPFKGLKEGFKNFPNLSTLGLIRLKNLTEIPDISRIPNLQKLRVSRCKSLVKIHDFVGFLDKLTLMSFFECTNLIHLPSSIPQLQHLDYLFVQGCPKLSTNVRDEGQSMLPIVSTEERRELFLSPPPANSSISDVGCSSVGFPALTRLILDKICFSETLFPSTLEVLDISWTEIVSLPAWIKRFVRLRKLHLVGCKQLQEILELPTNIKEISLGGCVSLESFPQISKENQFNTCQLPALKYIELTECAKMAEKIGNQVHYKDSFAGGIVFPGNRISDSLRHRRDCSYGSQSCIIDIKGLLPLDEIQGIVFCALLQPIREGFHDNSVDAVQFTMRHKGIDSIGRLREFKFVETKNVLHDYFDLEYFELKGDSLQVELSMISRMFVRSVGVHIIHKHAENAKDHPDVTHVDFRFSIDESNG
ncbi:disease resistance protein RPV1-like [Corylus avellana]|uniref:disease resistance protein RPV1-like n=1 Tax=Corylus avellana TaxID=13451 RepID=UPI00286CA4F4|nr:disease resistance protein RPV1-like [Corylus avellana]